MVVRRPLVRIGGKNAQLPAGDTLSPAVVGLGNVDNTSDTDKPVSTAQREALDAKAPLDSPALAGNPTAPTPAAGDSDTSIATTAHVKAAITLAKQTTPTDTTTGALMTVGAFGIGGKLDLRGTPYEMGVPSDYFDKGTVFCFARGGTDGLQIPGLGENSYGVLAAHGHWGDASGANGYCRTFMQGSRMWGQGFSSSSAWGPWVEFYNSGNILGTVSQSGGVPTGAIIERGSNANGEYTRFADGTQICTQYFSGSHTTTSYGSALYRCNLSWTYPAAFVAPPSFQGAGSDQGSLGWVGGASISPTSQPFYYFTSQGSSASLTVRVTAIGRWY